MPKCIDCKYEGKYSTLKVPFPIEMMVGLKLGIPGQLNLILDPCFEEEAEKHGFTKDDLNKKGMYCQAPGGGPTKDPIVLVQAIENQPCGFFEKKNEASEKRVAKNPIVMLQEFNIRNWIKLLHHDSNWKIEEYAKQVLVKIAIKNPRALEPLIKALFEDRDYYIRENVAEILGESKDPRAVEPLIKALGDSSWLVRLHVVKVLSSIAIEDPRAVEPLIKTLHGDKEYRVRQDAATALGKSKDIRAIEPLFKAMTKDENVRHEAAVALAKFNDSRAIEPLIISLEEGRQEYRQEAAEALGELKDQRAVKPLIKVLPFTWESLCQTVVKALVILNDPQAIEPLINKLISADDINIRQVASEALGELGEPKWKEFIKGDKEDFARLRQMNDPRVLKMFIKSLDDKNDFVCQQAAEVLGKIKDPQAKEPLLKSLWNKSGKVRLAVAEALCELGEPKWKEIINGNKEDYTRLQKISDPCVLALLIKFLGDGDILAAEALGKLHDPRAIDPLIKALGDDNKDVRQAAVKALGQMNDPRAEEAVKALGRIIDPRAKEAVKAKKNSKYSFTIDGIDLFWKAAEGLQIDSKDYKIEIQGISIDASAHMLAMLNLSNEKKKIVNALNSGELVDYKKSMYELIFHGMAVVASSYQFSGKSFEEFKETAIEMGPVFDNSFFSIVDNLYQGKKEKKHLDISIFGKGQYQTDVVEPMELLIDFVNFLIDR